MRRCWLDGFIAPPRSAQSPCSSSRAPPRVAFLIAGMLRGFDRQRIRQSFVRHVASPLLAEPAQGNFFIALKLLNDTNEPSRAVGSLAALERDLRALNPVGIHFRSTALDSGALLQPAREPGAPRANGRRACFETYSENVQGFLTTMRRALIMMRQHEVAVRTRYELVVFTRPDLLHLVPLPRWCEAPWAGVLNGTELVSFNPDHMFVLPRRAASAMRRVVESAMTAYEASHDEAGCELRKMELLGPLLTRRIANLRHTLLVPDERWCGVWAGPNWFCSSYHRWASRSELLPFGLLRSFAREDPTCPSLACGSVYLHQINCALSAARTPELRPPCVGRGRRRACENL